MKNHTDFIEKLPLEKREKFKTLIPEHQLLDIIVRGSKCCRNSTSFQYHLSDQAQGLSLGAVPAVPGLQCEGYGMLQHHSLFEGFLSPVFLLGHYFALVNETRPAQIFIFLVCLGNSTITCKETLSLLFCCGSRNFTCWVVSSLCLVVVSCCK